MYSSIAQANDAIIERIKAARPHWVAVRPAKEAVVELSCGRKLLHAGPPIARRDDGANARCLYRRIAV